MIVKSGGVPVDRNRARDQLNRGLRISLLMQHHAQQVQRVGMRWVASQNLAVVSRRPRQVSGAVLRDRGVENLRVGGQFGILAGKLGAELVRVLTTHPGGRECSRIRQREREWSG